jgi:rRNA biogenesis protein RRP5
MGYHPLDGLLQLSLRLSVLEQKFLQAGDILVGEVLKGTVKRLTDSALFVSISGDVDGIIWPMHYADIPLKHPSRRFKAGGSIKCRVHGSYLLGIIDTKQIYRFLPSTPNARGLN